MEVIKDNTMKTKFYFIASVLACSLVLLSSCDTNKVSGVNLSLANFEEILGKNISPLILQSINTPEDDYAHEQEESDDMSQYFKEKCLVNVTVEYEKGYDISSIKDAKNENSYVLLSNLNNSCGIIFNSKGDTLLRYSTEKGLFTSFITYAKLYEDFQNWKENPVISKFSGVIYESECGECGLGLIDGTMLQYHKDNDGNLFCSRRIVWFAIDAYDYDNSNKIVVDFYPNGNKKEYSLYKADGTRKLRKRYDEYGDEITRRRGY